MNAKVLTNAAAIEALSQVAQSWMQHRGIEVYKVYHGMRSIVGAKFDELPDWITGTPKATDAAGDFSRHILNSLIDSTDDEVSIWAKEAIANVEEAAVQVDPITLGIGGIILIGAILAARVKRIGSVEFYEGIPEELPDVLKAASSVN